VKTEPRVSCSASAAEISLASTSHRFHNLPVSRGSRYFSTVFSTGSTGSPSASEKIHHVTRMPPTARHSASLLPLVPLSQACHAHPARHARSLLSPTPTHRVPHRRGHAVSTAPRAQNRASHPVKRCPPRPRTPSACYDHRRGPCLAAGLAQPFAPLRVIELRASIELCVDEPFCNRMFYAI
jgi:hypothetical protein